REGGRRPRDRRGARVLLPRAAHRARRRDSAGGLRAGRLRGRGRLRPPAPRRPRGRVRAPARGEPDPLQEPDLRRLGTARHGLEQSLRGLRLPLDPGRSRDPPPPRAGRALLVDEDRMRARGIGLVLLAFDVGYEIDLDAAAERLNVARSPEAFRHKRGAPEEPEVDRRPLRFTRSIRSLMLGPVATTEELEIAVYPFGGV